MKEKKTRNARRKAAQRLRKEWKGNDAPSVATLKKRKKATQWVGLQDVMRVVFVPECKKTVANGRGFHHKHKHHNTSSHVELARYERETNRIADRIEYASEPVKKREQFRTGLVVYKRDRRTF
tara:strand:- start:2385 stop:2753 length:369 start_codon:yes stop_codon:yes gene_type:complete